MRLFVAVTPPPEAVADLEAALDRVRAALPPGPRWVHPSAWHCTLVFLGEVGTERPRELDARLTRAAGRRQPFELAVRGAGRFGGRVLFAALGADVEGLRRLAAGARAAVRRSGVPVEDRAFRPHLTLARTHEPLDLRPHVGALASYLGPVWTVDAVELVRSHLGQGPRGGSRYEVLSRHPLSGR